MRRLGILRGFFGKEGMKDSRKKENVSNKYIFIKSCMQ